MSDSHVQRASRVPAADSVPTRGEISGPSVCDALRRAARALVPTSTTPRLDAEVLLAHVLSLRRAQLYVRWNDPLGSAAVERYSGLVQRRVAHEPVAYLVGKRCFYDVHLYVDRRVLIPRPETELLAEEALSWARARSGRPFRAVDVGTGSGALAIILAQHLPRAQVWAVDLSTEAVRVAKRNLRLHGLGARVNLVCGDLLTSLSGPFQLILANMPYIATKALSGLTADIIAFEPRLALDGGQDGLDSIRRLLAQCPDRLARPGLILLEIGDGQGQTVCDVARNYLPHAEITVCRDYAGLERVVRVERHAPTGSDSVSPRTIVEDAL